MKKKVYQKATMEVVNMECEYLLSASSPDTLQGPNTSGTGSEESDYYDLE